MRPGTGSARPPGAEPPTAPANPPWRGPSRIRRRHIVRHASLPAGARVGVPWIPRLHKAPTETAAAGFRDPSCPHRRGLSTAPMIFSRSDLDVATLNGIARLQGEPDRSREGEDDVDIESGS